MRAAALVFVALTLTGCETTAERSAGLERTALSKAHGAATRAGLSIHRRSQTVKVLSTTILASREGAAAIVTLRNVSASVVSNSPLLISVLAKDGSLLYSNSASGLAHSLVAAPLIAPHGEITWVDDQVQRAAASAGVTAEVGEGTTAKGAAPVVVIEGGKMLREGETAGAEGTAVNRSSVDQKELAVYAIATRAGRTVAAGRAVLPVLAAHSSAHFQLYFIGDPAGGRLQLSAPATSG